MPIKNARKNYLQTRSLVSSPLTGGWKSQRSKNVVFCDRTFCPAGNFSAESIKLFFIDKKIEASKASIPYR